MRRPFSPALLLICTLFLTAACSQAAVNRGSATASVTAEDCPVSTEQVELCAPAFLKTRVASTTAPLLQPARPDSAGPELTGVGPEEESFTPAVPLSSVSTSLSPSQEDTATPLAITPTPCPPDVCVYAPALPMVRPIHPPDNDQFDTNYRYGDTPGEWRSPHRGVDIPNPVGVQVYASASGRVIVAGDDLKDLYGPSYDFYGNLVILEHHFLGITQTVYSLYGHLSKVTVHTGSIVEAGDPIGEVGMSGVAMGTHLHFEVRVGKNHYDYTSNPELWLSSGSNGVPTGGLAGKILISSGKPSLGMQVVIAHISVPGSRSDKDYYAKTYLERQMHEMLPWGESFALGDLEPGWYRITFAQNGIQSKEVQIFPGQLTLAIFDLDEN